MSLPGDRDDHNAVISGQGTTAVNVHPEVPSEISHEKYSLFKGKNTFLCEFLKATKDNNNITENLSPCFFGILCEN